MNNYWNAAMSEGRVSRAWRLLSVVVSFVLAWTLAFGSCIAAPQKAYAAGNVTIAGVDLGYADGQYFNTIGAPCACHGKGICTTGGSACTCIHVSGTAQCYAWSMWVENKLYGFNEKSQANKFVNVISQYQNCTGSGLYSSFNGTVSAGAHIRTNDSVKGYAHSVSVISFDSSGIKITDCNHSGRCQIDVRTYTWDSFAAFMNGYGGIAFVSVCTNNPVPNVDNTISFDSFSVTNVTENDAKLSAWCTNNSGKAITEMGVYAGTTPNYMNRVVTKSGSVSWTRFEMSHQYADLFGPVAAGWTCYYQFFVKSNGVEYKSDIKQFVSANASVISYDSYNGFDSVSGTDASLSVWMSNPGGKTISEYGFCVGSTPTDYHYYKIGQSITWTRANLSYNLARYGVSLSPGKTYYVRYYSIVGNKRYLSDYQVLKTPSSAVFRDGAISTTLNKDATVSAWCDNTGTITEMGIYFGEVGTPDPMRKYITNSNTVQWTSFEMNYNITRYVKDMRQADQYVLQLYVVSDGYEYRTSNFRIAGMPEGHLCSEIGHYWSDWVVTKESTCGEQGSKTRTCIRGDAQDTLPVAALPHDYAVPSIAFAADGKTATATWTCKNDSAHIESAACSVSPAVTKQATCETAGETTYYALIDLEGMPAGSASTVRVDVPALGHSYGAPVIAFSDDGKSATATWTCSRDGSHTESAVCTVTSEVTKPATNDEAGETTYTAVAAANDALGLPAGSATTMRVDIPALGHAYGPCVITFSDDGKSATATWTCTTNIYDTKTATCSVTKRVTTNAGCTTWGVTTYTATTAGDSSQGLVGGTLSTTRMDVAPWGHTWNAPVFEYSPDGKMCIATWTCMNGADAQCTQKCNYAQVSKTEATCTEPATTTYLVTTTPADMPRKSETKTVETSPALGHEWGVAEVDFADDMVSATATWTCGRDGSHVHSATCDVSNRATQAATCFEDGYVSVVASAVGPDGELFALESAAEVLPATGHHFDGLLCADCDTHIGDVNASGEVNIVDAQIAYDIACNRYDASSVTRAMFTAADVKADGSIFAEDAFVIQYAIHRGWID